MRIMYNLLATTLITIVLTGCTSTKNWYGSGQNISIHITVADEPIPTTGTFDWGPQVFSVNYNKPLDLSVIDQRMRTAIIREMKKRGYTQATSTESADVLVGYAVALDAPIDESALNQAYDETLKLTFPRVKPNAEKSYHRGAMLVDVVSNAKKKLLWRGAVTADVKMDVSEEEKKNRLSGGIGELLANFPKPPATY